MDEDDNDKSGSNKFIFNDFSQAEIRNFRQKIIHSTQIPEDIKGPVLIWFSNAIAEQKWRYRQLYKQAYDTWTSKKESCRRNSRSIAHFILLVCGLVALLYSGYNHFSSEIELKYGYINGSNIWHFFLDLLDSKEDKITPFLIAFLIILIIAFSLSFVLASVIAKYIANIKYGKVFNYKDHDLPEIYDQE